MSCDIGVTNVMNFMRLNRGETSQQSWNNIEELGYPLPTEKRYAGR